MGTEMGPAMEMGTETAPGMVTEMEMEPGMPPPAVSRAMISISGRVAITASARMDREYSARRAAPVGSGSDMSGEVPTILPRGRCAGPGAWLCRLARNQTGRCG